MLFIARACHFAVALATISVLAVCCPCPMAQAQSGTALSAANAGPTGGLSVHGETAPIHDPALVVADDGVWYVYATGRVNRENGGAIQFWTSHDQGLSWAYGGTIWDEIPAWIDAHFSDGTLPDNLWAPEIYLHDGTYYLYYSASRFGTNTSLTALATNTTLDPSDPEYAWVDQGLVLSSPNPIENGKTFNAIDAGIIEDESGTPYMAIGSYWYGIFLVELQWPSGKLAPSALDNAVHLLDRFMVGNPVEGSHIAYRNGYYYLFASFDYCCRGLESSYKIAVGRSETITGPYIDQLGQSLVGGGGTILLADHGAIVGPGGQSLFGDVLAFHYYDAANEALPGYPTLGLQRLDWTADGWPVADSTVELPSIVDQPQDVTVRRGRDARQVTVSATVAGTPAPIVAWDVSYDGGLSWTRRDTVERAYDGQATLTLKNLRPRRQPLKVRTLAANPHGSVLSEPATITVQTRKRPWR